METSAAPPRLRDRQREQTRGELAVAALALAIDQGLANVRVPQIAAAAGVSTRTFNNYFSSKEAAITWPARRRAARMAEDLLTRPADEPLAAALEAAIVGRYGAAQQDGLPPGWLCDFRRLVAAEPALHGEYLKASHTAELALAAAIAARGGYDELGSAVLAAMVVGAERAAVMRWMQDTTRSRRLVETVRTAVRQAVAGVGP